jgi:diacylglycerol kinase (ATP)
MQEVQLQEVPVTTTTSTESSKQPKGIPPPLAPFTAPAADPISIKKVVLIFNPVSGGRRGKKLVEQIVIPAFREAGVEVVALATERVGHATELAATTDLTGFDALCALGGDGTLSDVLNGYMKRAAPPPIPLGFLPGGTGNTFLHDVNGKKQKGAAAVRAAVATILGGATRKIDLSRLEFIGNDGMSALTRYSMNIVTAGLGVDINAKAETRRWMGPARYSITQTLEILKMAFGRKNTPCTFTVDGTTKSFGCFVICIMNNKFTGASIRVCPKAQLDDGKVDVMYTERKMRVAHALKLDGMIKKGGAHVNDSLVTYEHASKSIELNAIEGQAALKLMVDGDILGMTPLKLDVVPQAFTLLTPPSPPPS